MRNVLHKTCRENKNKICSKHFSENRAVYEIVWKNVVHPDSPQMIRRMRIAFWVSTTTDTYL